MPSFHIFLTSRLSMDSHQPKILPSSYLHLLTLLYCMKQVYAAQLIILHSSHLLIRSLLTYFLTVDEIIGGIEKEKTLLSKRESIIASCMRNADVTKKEVGTKIKWVLDLIKNNKKDNFLAFTSWYDIFTSICSLSYHTC